MRFRLLIVILAMYCAHAARADELTDDEKSVRDREHAYWEYVKNNDIPGYRSLWDERFVGWPGFSRTPM